MFLDESLFSKNWNAVVSATVVIASSQGLRKQKSVTSNKSAENSQNSLVSARVHFVVIKRKPTSQISSLAGLRCSGDEAPSSLSKEQHSPDLLMAPTRQNSPPNSHELQTNPNPA